MSTASAVAQVDLGPGDPAPANPETEPAKAEPADMPAPTSDALAGAPDGGGGEVALLDVKSSAGMVKKRAAPRSPFNPGTLDESTRKEILSHRQVEVPGYKQTGGYCGVYALKMVMAFHHGKNSANGNPPANDGGDGDQRCKSMVQWGKENRIFWGDGGTTHWGLEEIAEVYGYDVDVDSSPTGFSHQTVGDLKKSLEAGRPPIVSVADIDDATGSPKRGSPSKTGHWLVVEGFCEVDGERYMIVKHGHSTDSYIWRVSDFEPAWSDAYYATVYLKPK